MSDYDAAAFNQRQRAEGDMNTNQEELDLSQMLTPAEVAEMVGVALSTLAAWRRRRDYLPFYRRGGRGILYKRVEVEAFMNGTRVDPRPLTGVRVEATNS